MFKFFKSAPKLLLGLISLVVLGVVIVLLPWLVTHLSWMPLGKLEANEIGDTVGGIAGPAVGFVGAGLTFLAFWAQYEANQEQRRQFKEALDKQQKHFDQNLTEQRTQFQESIQLQQDQMALQQFESHFLEMLRLHKANVDDLSINKWSEVGRVSKRQVFSEMADHLHTMLEQVVCRPQPISAEDYKVCYEIFFRGFSSKLIEQLSASAQTFFIHGVGAEQLGNSGHTGYASFLGQYYRHLFMMVKYVATSPVVKGYDDKMKYLKILRAQLSNNEQLLLFYNWLSGFGEDWEDEKNKFFTEYKMIHNIWVDDIFQDQYLVGAVNTLIDDYNLNPKSTPLFEFQGADFTKKMPDIPVVPIAESFE